ncbi:MAG: hypothetical protein U5L45_24775 [Saprospiraceae bacterium]|nr:hypothetical protein [Saprospiraceae bacterium]
MVRFSGFARKTNHIPLFCERSERVTKKLRKIIEIILVKSKHL